jgi:hypothetical protein
MSTVSTSPSCPRYPLRRVVTRGAKARAWGVGLPLLVTLAACGDSPRAVDAQAASSAESAEISIRFDVSAGKPTTVQVMAFRATTTSTSPGSPGPLDWYPDVLGIVDPLAAASPEQGCALRDIDLAATTLMLRGGSIELREMTGIGVGVAGLPGAETLVRPFPRLYPDVATIVGGVVAEAGPQPLAALPEHVTLFTAESELPAADLLVPPSPRVVALNGAALEPGLHVDAQNGVAVTIAGGAGARIELRPFGATIAAACAIPANAGAETVVTIPRPFIAQLARSMGVAVGAPFAASLEVARRTHLLQSLNSANARVSVEVRSAATVELRP